MAIGSFILKLFGIRTITQAFIPTPDQPYLEIDPTFATVVSDPANERNVLTFPPGGAAGTLTLGSQTPPQFVGSVGVTTTITSGTVPLLTIPVPIGSVVSFDMNVNAKITMPVPGIIIPGILDLAVLYSNYGTSGPCLVYAAPDPYRTTTSSPFIAGLVTINTSGNNVIPVAHVYTAPAWVALTAYTGGFADGSTLPNAVGDSTNAIVSNVSNLYVCTAPGTSASSGGPTSTGAGPITDGTVTWYYVGPAGGGLGITVTVTFVGVKTG